MELSRGVISAPLPPPMLRPAPALRLGRRLPFGAFSPTQPLPNVVGVFVPFAWSSCPPDKNYSDGFSDSALLRLLQREHGCCMSRALRPRQEWVEGWVRSNDTLVRGLPILVGGASLVAVLLNRTVSGIAAVADASRTWDSLTTATCCKSLVVVYGGNCILQIGVAAGSPEDGNALIVDTQKFIQGSLYKSAMESKKRAYLLFYLEGFSISFQKFHCSLLAESYLANLALYPGRSELPFLPANTQALILQPIGDKGIAIVGGDTIRGFTNTDQAWIAMIADKLDATLLKS